MNRPKNNKIAVWYTNKYNSQYGDYYYNDALNSFKSAFSYKEFEDILKKSNWKNYEHVQPILSNIFQFACTKVKKREIKRKINLKDFSQKKDYYLLKFLFMGKV